MAQRQIQMAPASRSKQRDTLHTKFSRADWFKRQQDSWCPEASEPRPLTLEDSDCFAAGFLSHLSRQIMALHPFRLDLCRWATNRSAEGTLFCTMLTNKDNATISCQFRSKFGTAAYFPESISAFCSPIIFVADVTTSGTGFCIKSSGLSGPRTYFQRVNYDFYTYHEEKYGTQDTKLMLANWDNNILQKILKCFNLISKFA